MHNLNRHLDEVSDFKETFDNYNSAEYFQAMIDMLSNESVKQRWKQ